MRFTAATIGKLGPREATLADIDSYTTVVVRLDDVAIKGLRALPWRAEPR
jgi:hypothetical protein